ncbi:bifunctional DNA primase/polymerase [Microcoleus sp. C2C3]|uniref:bifunctional DNA primase/polymerase n=1 Tax=unclassified Microcoleus TaxID=2642155 RepID=UPI002FD1B288
MTSVLDLSQVSNFDLSKIPYTRQLVPVAGKRPYEKNWVNKEYDHSEILAELQTGKATGVGLKLGNGLLAVDIDGESAAKLLLKLSGQNTLPVTTAWTSGRPGRRQYLLSVEEKNWPRCRNLRIGTGIAGDDGKEECLEFRWLGTQSVLPPSIHPLTKKPYTWINNPLQTPPALAPEWLIALCENWHSEYAGIDEIDLVRFPSRLFPYFGRQMSVWLLARRFDISRWKYAGKSKGCGIGGFSLQAAAKILNRSTGHVRKMLRAAKLSGLIRRYKQHYGWITVYYSSLEKVIAIAGLDKLGPVATIKVDDLRNLHIIATEVEAQNLQRSSFHLQRREEIAQIKPGESSGLYTPAQLMTPTSPTCDKLARVLGRSQRFIFCKSGFKFYGGSQEALAQLRGLSVATVSRHLSNRYRLKASPVRGFRRDLPPIIKKQLLERLPHLQNMPPKICLEEGLFSMGGEWWKPHCNVYALNHRLVSARRRRGRIQAEIDKRNLCSKKIEAAVEKKKDNKFSLSNPPVSKIEEKQKCSSSGAKKPGQRKAKTIIAQQ